MRILLLCEDDAESWDAWSGITKSILDHLRAAGHTVHTCDVDLSGTDRYLAAGSTFALNRHRWGTRYHLAAVPFRLRSRNARRSVAAQEGRIDAILQIGATFDVGTDHQIPYFLCCDSNIRVAQQGASSGYSDASALTAAEIDAVARREMHVYRGASAIFPLSARLGRSFTDDFGVPAERVTPILAGPNLDLSRIPPMSVASGGRPPTILFVGRQFNRKGGDVLLESFRRIRRQLPGARCLVAGQPKDFLSEEGVTCLGDLNKHRPDEWDALVAAYQSSDVFVLPTRFEPFGIAFVEAMHFGLPCIGPRAWAVPEIITDGETGFTVAIDDVEALTERTLRVLQAPALARTMGDAARERARGDFTWPRVVDRMTKTMERAIDSRTERRRAG